MTNDQLQFIDYRKPKLEAGEYIFNATHLDRKQELKVRVRGERIKVDKKEVFAQYPPPGETGDFADTIPHISFRKGTLPWIRSAYSHDEQTGNANVELYEPWMFLLVVNENDLQAERVKPITPCPIHQLAVGAYFPSHQRTSLIRDQELTAGQKTVDTVRLKKELFQDVLLAGKPTPQDKDQIEYLAHLRRRWTEHGKPIQLDLEARKSLNDGRKTYDSLRKALPELKLPVTAKRLQVISKDRTWLVQDSLKGDLLLDVISNDGKHIEVQRMQLSRELSVLLANRFGQSASTIGKKGRNIAMVISLENYLSQESMSAIRKLGTQDWMQFIVLHSWEFFCESARVNFEERTKKLNANALRYPDADLQKMPDFEHMLANGYVPLAHTLRNNDQGLSWYRGPLVPVVAENWSSIKLTEVERGREAGAYQATDADRFLRYHPENGMMDISYSSAYELGRILSLRQGDFLRSLRQYKKNVSRHTKLQETDAKRMSKVKQLGIQIHELPYAFISDAETHSYKKEIHCWLKQLASFTVVPFWYLVPDKRLLPPKSVCTFNVDPYWIQALWLGALSLDGRPQITDQLFEECWKALHWELAQAGAFLYSEIVWAYPELVVHFRNIDEQAVSMPDHLMVDLNDLALQHFSGTAGPVDLEEIKEDFEDKFTDLIEMHPPIDITQDRRLKEDLNLYFSKRPFDYLSLSLPPESLHYGADFSQGSYWKDLKYRGSTVGRIEVPMLQKELGIVDVKALVNRIRRTLEEQIQEEFSPFNSARLGRYLLEGEPKVEFTVGKERRNP